MRTIEKKSLKVGKYVNNDHVDTLMRTYKQERWVANSNRLGKEDSLSSWYSVEELEEFIETIKMNGGDGLRLYFGAYPVNFTLKPEYAGRQTVVLVATRSKEEENGKLNHKDIYTTSDGTPKILAYNMGTLCPPYCPGPTQPNGSGTGSSFDLGRTIVDLGEKGMTIV